MASKKIIFFLVIMSNFKPSNGLRYIQWGYGMIKMDNMSQLGMLSNGNAHGLHNT